MRENHKVSSFHFDMNELRCFLLTVSHKCQNKSKVQNHFFFWPQNNSNKTRSSQKYWISFKRLRATVRFHYFTLRNYITFLSPLPFINNDWCSIPSTFNVNQMVNSFYPIEIYRFIQKTEIGKTISLITLTAIFGYPNWIGIGFHWILSDQCL